MLPAVLYMYRCTICITKRSHSQYAMPRVSQTDFRTTDLADVNWTVTVINQRRLPPMLLMTPRITPPAQQRGREPPWRMDTKVSSGKTTFKVTKGHPQWCHSIGHIRLPILAFTCKLQRCESCTVSEILPFISQNLNRSSDLEQTPFGENLSCMH